MSEFVFLFRSNEADRQPGDGDPGEGAAGDQGLDRVDA